MKEFWKKHHWAIIATGGILFLLYVFYEYEQAQAANAANAANEGNEASQLAAEELPFIGGSGGGGLSLGSSPTGASSGGSGINNYTNTPTPTTATSIPNTSGSGVPNSSPGNAPTQAASPTITIPSTGTAPGSPYNPNPGTTSAQDQALYVAAKAANAASFCYDAAPGLTPTAGLSACGPQGGGSASNLGTAVSGFLPGQVGYTEALEGEISADQTANPQAVAGLQQMLQQYGGYDLESEGTGSPGSGAPAGSTQTGSKGAPPVPTAPAGSTQTGSKGAPSVPTAPNITAGATVTRPAVTTQVRNSVNGVTPQPPITPATQIQQNLNQQIDSIEALFK